MTQALRASLFIVVLLLLPNLASAVVRTDLQRIAVLNDPAPVSNGDAAFFKTFQSAMINNNGDVAFVATINNAAGNLTNGRGIWATESGVLNERVREGQMAPGTAPDGSSLFSTFSFATFNDVGQIGFLGHTNETTYRAGYWVNSPTTTVPVAVRNTTPNGFDWHYSGIFYEPALNNQGQMSFNLSVVPSGETTQRAGVFINDSTTVDPVAFQGDMAPGTLGLYSSIFRHYPAINESGQTAFQIGIIDPDTGQQISTALYAGSSQSLDLVAQSGMSAPGTDANFSTLGSSRLPINVHGDTAFRASLQGGTSSVENNQGIWRSRNGVAELLARKGDVAIPATESSAAALFANFPFDSLIADTDEVIFAAELAGAGITASNRSTLWSAHDGELALLLQSGMPAPGMGEPFSNFLTGFSSNRLGQVAFRGTAGGKTGIWAQDPSGAFRLIVSSGDMLEVAPGELRTVAAIDFFSLSGGSDGRSRVINDAGEIVFNVTFSDGSRGIFVSEAAGYFMADFDRDGDVDGDDLEEWQAAYNTNAIGDADGDGDSDGRDFLTWQRQFTGPGPLAAGVTVPEPVCGLLLTSVVLIMVTTRSKAKKGDGQKGKKGDAARTVGIGARTALSKT